MAHITIVDLKPTDTKHYCQELTEYEQLTIQGGGIIDWLKSAAKWVGDHLTFSTKSSMSKDSGIFIGYKGTHDFPNNIYP